MKPTKKGITTRSIYYRRLTDPLGVLNGATLESKLREALDETHASGAGKSVLNRSLDGERTYALNFYEPKTTANGSTFFFGEIIAYERGAHQSYIEHNSNARWFSISQMPPGENKSWLDSVMYFIVKGNNVVATQSTHVRFQELQSYIRWLLCFHTKVLPNDFKVTLSEKADSSVTGEDYEKVTSIHIKDPNSSIKSTSEMFTAEQKRLRLDPQSINDFFWALLRGAKEVFSSSENSADIDYKMLSKNFGLRPDLTFRIDRAFDKKNQASASTLANFLMQLPDDFVEFGIPGGTISNGKLKLVSDEKIQTIVGANRLDPESAARVLYGVYTSWVNNKRIPAL
ncbi:hypothetical protein [Azospirillum sp.]|uniref:hypothetical protein n=1 Tax=Azospirillum sp. TaxID=34012 RepID=UPI002D73D173|nr:hypothetical protein [Azospirillum sp.]HYF85957.1 hypothetical protein [Azospirillum sp.]